MQETYQHALYYACCAKMRFCVRGRVAAERSRSFILDLTRASGVVWFITLPRTGTHRRYKLVFGSRDGASPQSSGATAIPQAAVPSEQPESGTHTRVVQHNGYFAKKLIRLVGIVVAQLLIFIFACSWLAVEIAEQCISFDGFLTQMIVAQPRISTTVVTLMATAFSLASTVLFGFSVREAMRHFLWKPRALVEVSAGVALVKGSPMFKWGYLRVTIVTCFVFVVLKLLVTGWTTLLAPTLVSCYYVIEGTELSITSPAFSDLLAIELNAFAPTIIHDDSFPIIDVGGSVSGIAAAGVSFGMPGIINFNQAKYNLSTGGLLPAIESFAGSKTPPGTNGTRMQFSGGTTIVNTTISHGSSGSIRNWLGIQRNFSVHQQGITADVNCQIADASSQVMNFTNLNTTIPVPLPGSTSPAYTLITWNSTANCNTMSLPSNTSLGPMPLDNLMSRAQAFFPL
ncbi:hypothetical protein BS17DRAFT_189880 [Gyrodon lividus]|nr:hypothetical protein BS17DRAFT_189880 [Gyrodon lividus]